MPMCLRARRDRSRKPYAWQPLRIDWTPLPVPKPFLDFANADCMPAPNPSAALTGGDPRDSHPDTLNTPDGACSRFPGVARLRVRDAADRCFDRRLTHDRCLEQ